MALITGLLIFAGCSVPLEGKPKIESPRGNRGLVTVQVGGASARTLQPELGFSRYDLAFTGLETHAPETLEGRTSATVLLAAGQRTINVTAFAGSGAGAKKAAVGSATVTVRANGSETVAISLAPYAETDAEAGTLAYTVSYPAGLASGTLAITTPTGTALADGTVDLLAAASGNLDVPAGQYKLQIRLTDGAGLVAGRTEVLHIYPTLTTTANYAFTDADFVAFAEADDVTVSGTVELDNGGAPVNADVAITLYNDSFKTAFMTADNLSGWTSNLPEGLSAAPKAAVAKDAREITLAISGNPAAPSDEELSITIPVAALNSNEAITVRSNPNAKFAIGLPAASATATVTGTLRGGKQGYPTPGT
jgi:hypothetical protein